MIIFIYGTTAEAIKLAPIARRLDVREIPYQHWITYHHTESLRKAIPELGFHEPEQTIANGHKGKSLTSPFQMLKWIADISWWSLKNVRKLRRTLPTGTVVVVHGDTMTTVLGTLIGRRLRVPVAHVEAGLRSGNWRHPFPEELDRRIVGRLAHIHYAPSEEAVKNLGHQQRVVNTHGNTARDAVLDAVRERRSGDEPYGLALLHRFEFVSNTALVRETLTTLDRYSPVGLRIIVDSYSRPAMEGTIAELGLTRIEVIEKLEHGDFVELMQGAEFIVTDSGGIQQEAAVFGVPTLIHRKVTESEDGIGTSAVLSGWDQSVLSAFLADSARYRVDDPDRGLSPSEIIVADLASRGFAGP